jgi:hypothetical protein
MYLCLQAAYCPVCAADTKCLCVMQGNITLQTVKWRRQRTGE